MTTLTQLTPDQVKAVLLGLSEQHASGTRADQARAAAVAAMADALTTRPVEVDLHQLRYHRDLLSSLLGLDPWCTDDEITRAVTARADALETQRRAMVQQLAEALGPEPEHGWQLVSWDALLACVRDLATRPAAVSG